MTKEKDPEYYHNSLSLYAGVLRTKGIPAIADFMEEVSLVLRDREAEMAILYADQRAMVDEIECLKDELNSGLRDSA